MSVRCSLGHDNPDGSAFCDECGEPLTGAAPAAAAPQQAAPSAPPAEAGTQVCPSCGAVNPADNQEFDLAGKDNITIGREDAVSSIYPDVDLTPHGGEEGGVSRLHARIFNENGQYLLEDENSTNFTFLNRQRLAAKTPTPLSDNDEVRLGRVLLRFKTP